MIHKLYPGLKLPFCLSQEGKESYFPFPVCSLRKNRPFLQGQSPASPVRGQPSLSTITNVHKTAGTKVWWL